MTKRRKDTSVLLGPLTFEEVIRELAKAPNHDLEDYAPGASRLTVFNDLRKTAKPIKAKSQKRVAPPAKA